MPKNRYAIVYFPTSPYATMTVYRGDADAGAPLPKEARHDYISHYSSSGIFDECVLQLDSVTKPVAFIIDELPAHVQFYTKQSEQSLLQLAAQQFTHSVINRFHSNPPTVRAFLGIASAREMNQQCLSNQRDGDQAVMVQMGFTLADWAALQPSLTAGKPLAPDGRDNTSGTSHNSRLDAKAMVFALLHALANQQRQSVFVVSGATRRNETYFCLSEDAKKRVEPLVAIDDVVGMVSEVADKPMNLTEQEQLKADVVAGTRNLQQYLSGLNRQYPGLAQLFLLTLMQSKYKAAWGHDPMTLEALMAQIPLSANIQLSAVTDPGFDVDDFIVWFDLLDEYAQNGTLHGRPANIDRIVTSNELRTSDCPDGVRVKIMQFIIAQIKQRYAANEQAINRLNQIEITTGQGSNLFNADNGISLADEKSRAVAPAVESFVVRALSAHRDLPTLAVHLGLRHMGYPSIMGVKKVGSSSEVEQLMGYAVGVGGIPSPQAVQDNIFHIVQGMATQDKLASNPQAAEYRKVQASLHLDSAYVTPLLTAEKMETSLKALNDRFFARTPAKAWAEQSAQWLAQIWADMGLDQNDLNIVPGIMQVLHVVHDLGKMPLVVALYRLMSHQLKREYSYDPDVIIRFVFENVDNKSAVLMKSDWLTEQLRHHGIAKPNSALVQALKQLIGDLRSIKAALADTALNSTRCKLGASMLQLHSVLDVAGYAGESYFKFGAMVADEAFLGKFMTIASQIELPSAALADAYSLLHYVLSNTPKCNPLQIMLGEADASQVRGGKKQLEKIYQDLFINITASFLSPDQQQAFAGGVNPLEVESGEASEQIKLALQRMVLAGNRNKPVFNTLEQFKLLQRQLPKFSFLYRSLGDANFFAFYLPEVLENFANVEQGDFERKLQALLRQLNLIMSEYTVANKPINFLQYQETILTAVKNAASEVVVEAVSSVNLSGFFSSSAAPLSIAVNDSKQEDTGSDDANADDATDETLQAAASLFAMPGSQ